MHLSLPHRILSDLGHTVICNFSEAWIYLAKQYSWIGEDETGTKNWVKTSPSRQVLIITWNAGKSSGHGKEKTDSRGGLLLYRSLTRMLTELPFCLWLPLPVISALPLPALRHLIIRINERRQYRQCCRSDFSTYPQKHAQCSVNITHRSLSFPGLRE